MDNPVSVIIPTYNRDHLLERCIKSVLAAVADQDEVIVVNSGDSDDTAAVIAAFDDPRIRYVKQPDAGVSASRNLGMELSRNDLIAFIDDDDEWHPQKLNVQRQLLAMHPEAVACFTNIWATDSSGVQRPNYLFEWGQPIQDWNQLLGETKTFRPNGFDQDIEYYFGNHYFNQMLDDYVLPSSLLIDRSRFKEQFEWRVGMQRNESWLFTSRVCRQGPVIFVDYDLACHHGDAPNRLTAIPHVETVMSRLYVLENEFGKQQGFLQEHQVEFDRRIARELDTLFRSVMGGGTSNRRESLAAAAHHGGKIALLAKLPEPVLSIGSIGYRGARTVRRMLLGGN